MTASSSGGSYKRKVVIQEMRSGTVYRNNAVESELFLSFVKQKEKERKAMIDEHADGIMEIYVIRENLYIYKKRFYLVLSLILIYFFVLLGHFSLSLHGNRCMRHNATFPHGGSELSLYLSLSPS